MSIVSVLGLALIVVDVLPIGKRIDELFVEAYDWLWRFRVTRPTTVVVLGFMSPFALFAGLIAATVLKTEYGLDVFELSQAHPILGWSLAILVILVAIPYIGFAVYGFLLFWLGPLRLWPKGFLAGLGALLAVIDIFGR